VIREWYTTQIPRLAEWFGKRSSSEPPRAVDAPPVWNASAPFAGRVDPNWSPEWIRRTLTDEPGQGMGAPFSDAQAELFLRACGLSRSTVGGALTNPENAALLHRMWDWVVAHDR
jgi:hypothetical protein